MFSLQEMPPSLSLFVQIRSKNKRKQIQKGTKMFTSNKSSKMYLAQRTGAYLLERTTDLSVLNGRRALVLLDEQNLSSGAIDHGFRLDYRLLVMQIRRVTSKADLHIFIASKDGDNRAENRFEKFGYCTHVKTIRYILQDDSQNHRDSNIDNLFAFWAGIYSMKTNWDAIVFGSGDFGLSGELSRAISNQQRTRRIKIMTMSLPGSTSQELNAASNPAISANIEIGTDVLIPRHLPLQERHLA